MEIKQSVALSLGVLRTLHSDEDILLLHAKNMPRKEWKEQFELLNSLSMLELSDIILNGASWTELSSDENWIIYSSFLKNLTEKDEMIEHDESYLSRYNSLCKEVKQLIASESSLDEFKGWFFEKLPLRGDLLVTFSEVRAYLEFTYVLKSEYENYFN